MRSRMIRETRPCVRPSVEPLEGRVVLSTFHVTTVAELEADVAMLNNSSGPNTIILKGGIYNLTSPLQINNANGLTIEGRPAHPGNVILFAPEANRAFDVNGGNVTLTGLTIAGGGGVDNGGGILSQNADLTVRYATVSGNTASDSGGGIYASGGTLNLTHASILSNGVVSAANSAGGGIGASNATVVVAQSTIADDTAVGFTLDPQSATSANAAGIFMQGGTLSITGSAISHNSVLTATMGPAATSVGGGVATVGTTVTANRLTGTSNGLVALSAGVNSKRGSSFSTNTGSLTVSNSTLTGNLPDGTGQFDHSGATVVLRNTTVDGNKLIRNRTITS